MIALDTNVLVRFLIEDDAEQLERAAELIERAEAKGEQLFVATIVVCELVWVLSFSYDRSRQEIVDALETLAQTSALKFEHRDRLLRALERFAREPGDLSDFLILEAALAEGAHAVATFDRKLQSREGFTSP